MNNEELKDHAARRAAIEDHSQSLFIDAGAGTGKTETIVKRIVNRLIADSNVGMLNVAAITFTDKAGAELRNRFRKVLGETIAEGDEITAVILSSYINEVDSAAIGTIHSFCKRILTDYSIAARLPVGFTVASEDDGPTLRRERVKRVTEKSWDSLSKEEVSSLHDSEITIRKMRDLVFELDAKFSILSTLVIDSTKFDKDWERAAYKFIEYAINFLGEEQIGRKQKGSIEFDDLLMFTRDLLKENLELRLLVANNFQVLVVDEFQDTDPIQWEIIQMVVSPEEISVPKPGSLVLVGDPKQSIYRFRNADIHTFIKVKKLFNGQGSFGALHELKSNFRTVNPIIEFINNVFVDKINGIENPLFMGIEYNKLEYVHSPEITNPGPAVVIVNNPETSLAGLVEHEFKQIAAEIARAIKEGYAITKRDEKGNRVYDENRRANFGDICILLPVRTHIGKLARALDELNIPYRSSDPGILFDLPLILGLVNTLRVIALTDDDLSLMAALKSPIFGLTDDQLFQYIKTQGATWSTEGGAVGDSPVSDALNSIYEIRKASEPGRPSKTLKLILQKQRIFESLVADKNGKFEASALRMLISHAYNWENQGKSGLLDYLDALEVLMDEKSRISLPLPSELNSDAVQIMTIHSAKGLEFPITVVAGMASQKKKTPETLLISKAGQIEFNLGKNSAGKPTISSGYDALAKGEIKNEQKQEENRLLYVAMTRAQDHLIVSAVGQPTGGNVPRSRQLIEALRDFSAAQIELPLENSKFPNLEPFTSGTVLTSGLDYVVNMSFDFESQIQSSSVRRVVSPSSEGATEMNVFAKIRVPGLMKSKDTEVLKIDDFEISSSLSLKQRDGRPFGRALHGTMDQIIRHGQIPSDELLMEFITVNATQENALEFLPDLEQRIKLLVKSEVILEALASDETYPELHLAITDPDDEIKVAEGFADLVYKSPSGGYVLVDYKTDKEILGEQLIHYSQQLGAYAIILEAITGQKPERILLLHAKPSTVATIPL